MNVDLFGNASATKEIRCFVYHDEREIPSKWLYHGFLFIPVNFKKQFLERLAKERAESTWEKEIHFSDLKDTRTMNDLAVRWVKLFCSSYNNIYFYLLGINYNSLAKDLWDNRRTRDFKIYNRFFQIGLYGAIKWFFLNTSAGFQKVLVEKVFSDAKSRMPYDKFHSQPISEIDFKAFIEDEPIVFNCSKVVEVGSNHEDETKHRDESHLIQYVDLIIGGFSQAFDNTSVHNGKRLIAEILVNNRLPNEIMGYNHSHFKSVYYKKCAVSFFPKEKLSQNEIMSRNIFRQKNQFYNERTLAFCNENQINLFENL